MIELYRQKDFETMKKRWRNQLILSQSLMAFLLLSGALCYLFFPHNAPHAWMLLPFFFFLLAGWVEIFWVVAILSPLRKRIRTYTLLASATPEIHVGVLKSKDGPHTIVGGEDVFRLVFQSEEGTQALYYDSSFGECPLKEQEKIRYEKTGRYLTAYEEMADESEETASH